MPEEAEVVMEIQTMRVVSSQFIIDQMDLMLESVSKGHTDIVVNQLRRLKQDMIDRCDGVLVTEIEQAKEE